MKRELTVVEFEIYTDGDFYFNDSFLLNYTSKYFDPRFYEYTKISDYSYSARRVFDSTEDAIDFVRNIKAHCGRPDESNYILDDYIFPLIENVIQDYWKYGSGSDFYDSNQEFELFIFDVETDVKKIKHIEYEED
jgi:hypothetical protein